MEISPQKDNRLQLQMELEQLYNKNQLIPRIKAEFTDCTEFDFEGYMKQEGIKPEFGYDLLVQMVLHKRTTLSTLVGILRKHFEPLANASQHAADMLLRAAEADLVDWSPTSKQFVVKFDISDDVQAELDCYQFPLPMVVEPRTVNTNRDTGYLLGSGSIILKKNHHNDDVCLDHINRVNGIRFTIDQDTAFLVRNEWRNLDKPKEGETRQDYQKRVRSFDKYDRTSKDVIAKLISHGNLFYLTHRYDKRGRIYAQGYHCNYQGNAWNKACIALADKEFID